MATSYKTPTADFATTSLSGVLAAGGTTCTIGVGLNIPSTNGLLHFSYDTANAIGATDGPETASYATYTSGSGAITGLVRGLAGTTDVQHSSGQSVQTGLSSVHISQMLAGTAPYTFDKVRVKSSVNLSVTTGSNYTVLWDSEDFDTNGMHSTSSNTSRLTCVNSGYYHIFSNLNWAANSTGVRQHSIVLNGTTTIATVDPQHAGTTDAGVGLSTIYYMTAGDYVTLVAQQNSGGNLNILASYSHFGMTMIP